MNKLLLKRFGVLISSLLIISSVSFSQFFDEFNTDFLRGGPADGVTFLKKYITPWVDAFGAGLNAGWYNTAKPHKLAGFDITLNFSVGMVPPSSTTFDVSKIGLTTLTGTGTASTIAGPSTSGPTLTATEGGVTLASFKTPPGTNWKYVPIPMAQIGFGLPLGTEVKGRFIPKIPIGDGDLSLWGIGLMHGLVQYLPGSKLLPFDVSLFGGYTKLQGNIPLNLKPDNSYTWAYTTIIPLTAFDGQNLNLSVEALNVGLIASLNLPVVTLYGGLGYSKTNTEMKLTGKFPIPVLSSTPLPIHAEYNETKNSLLNGSDFKNLNIENFSGLRANIGLRIKLAVITIHADYTRAQYNVLSGGLGVSFR